MRKTQISWETRGSAGPSDPPKRMERADSPLERERIPGRDRQTVTSVVHKYADRRSCETADTEKKQGTLQVLFSAQSIELEFD